MKLTLMSTKDRKEPKDPTMTPGCQVDVHVDGKDNLIPTLSNGSIVQNVKEVHTLDNATKSSISFLANSKYKKNATIHVIC